jgi:hypothetical protein
MNPKIKISQLPAKGSNLAAADLLEVAEFTGTGYISKSITGQEIIDAAVGNVDWGDIGGTLSDQTDLNTALSGKVPTTRTLTINGVTQDLSADRTYTIATGLTVGTTPISSGTNGRVLFQGTGNVLQQSSSLFWDSTNNRLGIGTSTPQGNIDINATYATTGYPLIVKNTGYFNAFFQGTSANNQAAFYLENDRGSTNSYGGFAIGGSTSNLGNIFGLTRPDRLFMFADGVNNVGYAIGTLQNTPLQFGTNNVIRATVFGTGNIGINTTTDAGYRLDVNGTARVSDNLLLTNGIIATSTGTTRLQGSLNYFTHNRIASSGALGFQISSYGTLASFFRWSDATYDTEIGGAGSPLIGGLKFFTAGTEKTRITSGGNVLINTTTDAGFRLDVNGTARVYGSSTSSLMIDAVGVADMASSLTFRQNNSNWSAFIGTHQSGGGAVQGLQFKSSASVVNFAISLNGGTFFGGLGAANASAIVEMSSTTKGFLPPRMTTTQRNAIASPAAGLVVYDNTDNKHYGYNGTTWNAFY